MTKKSHTLTGTIQTTFGGLGFVPHPDFKDDIRIEQGHLNTALNGDTVELKLHARRKGGRPKGEVVKVIKRAKARFVGVLEREKGFCFLKPDDRRMYVDILIPEPPNNVPDGHKVLVEINEWKDSSKDPVGTVLEVLGNQGDHEVEIRSIVLERGIDTDFPKDVSTEAEKIKQEWDENGEAYIARAIDKDERRDFRTVTTFTIDPHDAKDFDDALSIRRIDKNLQPTNHNLQPTDLYEIGIHIADVSHFVLPNSKLDDESQSRGFSTYLVDRTIPMLPEELSNDLCSLNPNTDKLTFSAVFVLDENANVQERWFGRGVMHSDKRFSYEEAQETLNPIRTDGRQGQPTSDGTGSKKYQFRNELQILNDLAKKMRAKRFKKGSIDFASDEVKIELDEQNVPVKIYRKKPHDTNRMIEEYMLLANQEVAEFIFRAHGKKDIEEAFIYRVHDHPDKEKLGHLQTLLRALGYDLGKPGSKITSKQINGILRSVEGKPIENTISTALIRTMAKAQYATKNIGHFGLGFGYYTHFTSPIRRYSDLLVHRLLDLHLKHKEVPKREYSRHKQIAWDLSQKEISIQSAERESIKYKQVQYMGLRIGKEFKGVISGVTEWGLYVSENETGAEGLVRVASLEDDYYIFDERHYRLTGEKTKKTYMLGDTVKIKVMSTDVDKRIIDYIIL